MYKKQGYTSRQSSSNHPGLAMALMMLRRKYPSVRWRMREPTYALPLNEEPTVLEPTVTTSSYQPLFLFGGTLPAISRCLSWSFQDSVETTCPL